MANHNRLLFGLVVAFATASPGYGMELRTSLAAEGSSSLSRKALTESISRREMELALRERKDVLTDVERRIREMEVVASAEELTDLLGRVAYLQIDLDKCQLEGLQAQSCRTIKAEMATVEASFRKKTGLSMREFRGGQRDATAHDAARAALIGTGATKSSGDTCTCALSIFSGERWMNGSWALECNNHGSHGVCSNNVDSAHSPGTGAMTGDIDIYFGSYHQYKECPDDGTTCFHGPSTAHSGQWGNVCNCDTWHSQYYNPTGDWYGGDLSDSPWVHQVSTASYVTVAGSCEGASVNVSEYIKENDPICCDDPMGTLWASAPIGNGTGNVPVQTSAQNCNGGSQSGVYPNCGTFGATILVSYNCWTYSPPPPPECDPQAQQDCYLMEWNWDPSDCTCQSPCQPPPNCPYWNAMACLCEY